MLKNMAKIRKQESGSQKNSNDDKPLGGSLGAKVAAATFGKRKI